MGRLLNRSSRLQVKAGRGQEGWPMHGRLAGACGGYSTRIIARWMTRAPCQPAVKARLAIDVRSTPGQQAREAACAKATHGKCNRATWQVLEHQQYRLDGPLWSTTPSFPPLALRRQRRREKPALSLRHFGTQRRHSGANFAYTTVAFSCRLRYSSLILKGIYFG